MRALRGLVVLSGFLAAWPGGLLAQTVREHVNVDVVTVRLTARDRSGHFVADLKPSDLALAIDGQALAIDTLALVSGDSAGAPVEDSVTAPTTARHASTPSQLALLLDESQTRIPDRVAVYKELSRYVAASRPGDSVMVARFAGGTLEIACPWSSDAKQVTAAIDRLIAHPAEERIATASKAEATFHDAGPFKEWELMKIDTVRSRFDRAVIETIAAFPPGPATRKLVLVTSGTVLARPDELAAAFDSPHVEVVSVLNGSTACTKLACLRALEGARGGFELWSRALKSGASGLTMDDVVVKALERDVVLVPMASEPLAGGQNLGLDSSFALPQNTSTLQTDSVKAMWAMAEQTGGEPVLVPGKASARLAEIDGRATYELTFRNPYAADHHLHSIGIVSRRPGVHIEYKRAYRIQPDAERTLDTVVARLTRGDVPGVPDAGLSVALSAASAEGRKVTRVALTFAAPAETGLGNEREFDVIGVGERDDGARTEPVHFTAVGDRLDDGSTRFRATSDLGAPYGHYTWSFAVTDAATGLTSYSLVKPN